MKKKKIFFSFIFMLGLSSIFSSLSWALDFTVKEANEKYQRRSDTPSGMKEVREAIHMYHQLYQQAVDERKSPLIQAAYLIKEAKAIYFYAEHLEENSSKIIWFKKGWDVGEAASKLLHQSGSPTTPLENNYKPYLALAYYWTAANMGKWGISNGVTNSLRQWPELKETTNYILQLGEKEVEDYGANRILGRAYYTLPFPLGDAKLSLRLLQEAHQKTLSSDGVISRHSTNVLYYAETLILQGQKELAKKLLTRLVEVAGSTPSLLSYNDDRVPETKDDAQTAKKILSRL